jgi:hypothetical protein
LIVYADYREPSELGLQEPQAAVRLQAKEASKMMKLFN